jgi:hypothetical protein
MVHELIWRTEIGVVRPISRTPAVVEAIRRHQPENRAVADPIRPAKHPVNCGAAEVRRQGFEPRTR